MRLIIKTFLFVAKLFAVLLSTLMTKYFPTTVVLRLELISTFWN